jgi:hypothetical protein
MYTLMCTLIAKLRHSGVEHFDDADLNLIHMQQLDLRNELRLRHTHTYKTHFSEWRSVDFVVDIVSKRLM